MAGQNLTVEELKDTIRYRGDVESLLDRHPEADLLREINLSIRRFRQKLAAIDLQVVLEPTTIASLPTSEAVTDGNYAEIDWPVDAVSIHGIDTLVDGSWLPARRISFAARRRYQYNYGGQNTGFDFSNGYGYRFAYCVRSLPTQTNTTRNAGKIMLFPVPTGGQYVIWYLPEWDDLDADTDLIPGQDSWYEWYAHDVMLKILRRDADPDQGVQTKIRDFKIEQQDIWMDIKNQAMRVVDDAPREKMSHYRSGQDSGPRQLSG